LIPTTLTLSRFVVAFDATTIHTCNSAKPAKPHKEGGVEQGGDAKEHDIQTGNHGSEKQGEEEPERHNEDGDHQKTEEESTTLDKWTHACGLHTTIGRRCRGWDAAFALIYNRYLVQRVSFVLENM